MPGENPTKLSTGGPITSPAKSSPKIGGCFNRSKSNPTPHTTAKIKRIETSSTASPTSSFS
jgi:hypothetical protein